MTIHFSGKEGKTKEGCPSPIAKWILRRTNDDEKFLVVVKQRFGHRCDFTWTVVAIVQWDGVGRDLADRVYVQVAAYGIPTKRKCAANRAKNCACQGRDQASGATYTFGCTWHKRQKVCKFCESKDVHKVRLMEEQEEKALEDMFTRSAGCTPTLRQNHSPT